MSPTLWALAGRKLGDRTDMCQLLPHEDTEAQGRGLQTQTTSPTEQARLRQTDTQTGAQKPTVAPSSAMPGRAVRGSGSLLT